MPPEQLAVVLCQLRAGFFIGYLLGNPNERQKMTAKKPLQWHRQDDFDYSRDIAEKILWAGCLDAPEFLPAGSMYSKDFIGKSIPAIATVRRGCEWTWLDEECRVQGRPVSFHSGSNHPRRYG